MNDFNSCVSINSQKKLEGKTTCLWFSVYWYLPKITFVDDLGGQILYLYRKNNLFLSKECPSHEMISSFLCRTAKSFLANIVLWAFGLPRHRQICLCSTFSELSSPGKEALSPKAMHSPRPQAFAVTNYPVACFRLVEKGGHCRPFITEENGFCLHMHLKNLHCSIHSRHTSHIRHYLNRNLSSKCECVYYKKKTQNTSYITLHNMAMFVLHNGFITQKLSN